MAQLKGAIQLPQLPSLLPNLCIAIALLAAALACQQPQPTPSPTLAPTATPQAPTVAPTPTPSPTATPTPAPEPTPTPVIILKEIIIERPPPVFIEIAPPGLALTPPPTPIPPKDPIIFANPNWNSATLQTRIAQYIVEIGYRYPTAVKFGATRPLFHDMRQGNVDVLMEVWWPNQSEIWQEARNAGEALSLGESLSRDWQSAFVIPAYLQAQYPELDHIDDLRDPFYQALFATPETAGKARLVSCIIGWECAEVNAAQIRGYGLTGHIQIVNPADDAALNADLQDAYERRQPWLGYQWRTNDLALLLDLVRLEEPAYSDSCWQTTNACAYQDAVILIGATAELPNRAPEVAAMLSMWEFDTDQALKPAIRWQRANPQASNEDTALWWLNHHPTLWREWVTADAAAQIAAALAAGQTPAGWPE